MNGGVTGVFCYRMEDRGNGLSYIFRKIRTVPKGDDIAQPMACDALDLSKKRRGPRPRIKVEFR
jgi:hypothetical protein